MKLFMNPNYRPPQIQHKELITWAREFLVNKVDENAGEAARDPESEPNVYGEVDVDDFIAHVQTKGGKRFGRHNVKRWKKDARKALTHASRILSSDTAYIDRSDDKGLLNGTEELVSYPDENRMNRLLYHGAAANPPAEEEKAATPALEEEEGEGEGAAPARKRRRVRPQSPSAPAVPSLRVDDCAFADRGAVERLLMFGADLLARERPSAAEGNRAAAVLLLGPAGCGKSSLVRAVAGTLRLPLLAASGAGLGPAPAPALRALFARALAAAPCVLLLRDAEALPVVGKAGAAGGGAGVADAMEEALEAARDRVLVVGESAASLARLPDPVKRLFPFSVTLGALDLAARREAIRQLARSRGWDGRFSDEFVADLALRTPGFEVGDLWRLLELMDKSAPLAGYLREFSDGAGGLATPASVPVAHLRACRAAADVCAPSVVDAALAQVVPLARQKPGFVSVPSVTWRDVGALGAAKQELERFLTMAREPELAARLCRDAESLLLVGPPGCGKTLLAKALSNEASLNFVSVKGPELLHKYQGESERQVREVFERARACPPCLIFFDELDALCAKRGDDAATGHASVVLQLLTEMDGLTPRGRVFVMGATNRLDLVDEAFLRRGRMGRVVHVGPPASAGERASVLAALTRGGTRPRLEGDADALFAALAADPRADGFTGADLRGVVDEAKFAAHVAGRDFLTAADLNAGLAEARDCLARRAPRGRR